MNSRATTCLLAGLALTVSAHAAPMFVQPLEGVPYLDWTIVNYVDQDPTAGVQDYRGGQYSYDGHTGTDFTLANFVAMDSGFAVYAAANGSVAETHDGEFDRRTSAGAWPANYIKIDHGSGIQTWYWHLRKNSIIVTNGQAVTAGQKIAEVGSSGSSTDAHLHFEVRSGPSYADPFISGLWLSPIPYAGDSPGLLDSGITDRIPTFDELKERTTNDVVIGSDNSNFVHWVQVHGVTPTNTMRWEVYRQNGSLFADWEYSPPSTVAYGWYYAGWLRPLSDLGLWRCVFKVDGAIWSEIRFHMAGAGDSDGDGIDDFAESAPLQVGQDDRFIDSDNDGAFNADELLAGTDPGDAGSVLRLTNLVHAADGVDALSFRSVGGRFYIVESCTDLAAGEWVHDHPVPGVLTNASSTAAIDNGQASVKFYRLKLVVSP